MKNEKFELLLNKMVTYEKSEKLVSLVFSYKGFLYKNGTDSYYIKVVETELGPTQPGQLIYLSTGDEDLITFATKPKLMRVSLKSWHYKLMKFVLRDNTPTPQTMQNGCPYFWLLVFSMFALPFVLIGKGFKGLFLGVVAIIRWSLKSLVDSWLRSIDDAMAYDFYFRGCYGHKTAMPKTARLYFDNDTDDFFDYFLNEKYRLTSKLDLEEYVAKKKEMFEKWTVWTQEMNARREKERQEAYERSVKENERIRIQMLKREANKLVWDTRLKPFEEKFTKLFASFKSSCDWKVLIKRTKQFVGALITLIILAGTFFLVNIIAYLLIGFIDLSIAYWVVYVVILAVVALAGIGYVLYVIVGSWLQNVINKYKRGKKVWYIEPLIYLIWYPVKYIMIVVIYYMLWIPVKFFFYTFLWNILIVNIGKFIWKLLQIFGRGLANSTGVFGEYFGASYSDYCPGIEWVDSDEPTEQK